MTASMLTPGKLLIDDSFRPDAPELNAGMKGREPRDYAAVPFGKAPTSSGKFPDSMRIPRKDMLELAREKVAKNSTNRAIRKGMKVRPRNQSNTNYCWINAIVQALMITRAKMNLPAVDLSSASGGAQIKGYRNSGGWGGEALAFIVKYGIAPVSMWPANAIDRKYKTPECDAEMLKYRVTEWYEIEPGDTEAMASSLLLGYLGGAGLNWWGHEVCYLDVLFNEKEEMIIDFDNSWGATYGEDGGGYLTEKKARPSDYCCIRVATAA